MAAGYSEIKRLVNILIEKVGTAKTREIITAIWSDEELKNTRNKSFAETVRRLYANLPR